MHFQCAAALAACGVLFPAACHGQSKILRSEITYHTQFSDRQTAVCGIDVTTLFADYTYKGGALAGVRTSLSWAQKQGDVGVLLKVSGVDFEDAQPSKAQMFKVPNAFLTIDGAPLPITRTECEDKSSFCGSYWLPFSALIYTGLSKGTLAMGFNRQPAGLDVVFPIKVEAGQIADQESFTAFHKCVVELVRQASENHTR